MTSRTVVRLTGLEDIYKAVVVSGFTQSQASPTEALSVSKNLSARGLNKWEAATHHCPRHLHATIAAAATLAMRGVTVEMFKGDVVEQDAVQFVQLLKQCHM